MNKTNLQLHRLLTPFEALCVNDEAPKHLISAIYTLIMEPLHTVKTSYKAS